ncbi:pilus assembly PilX family protein [Cellulomonas soli]|uniref:pilus assembly PilX family protein n=1 Tax=Cellulomonas soli TaxID=931535 RepID=UPI003F8796FD
MPGSGVLRRVRGDGDEGMALVLVVGSMLVLAMLAFTALAFTMASQRFARYDQDYTSAMSAAQSGVDDYISRLNRSEAYTAKIDCANPAMQGPTTATNTCGWNAGTAPGWSPVDGTRTGELDAFFHYTVDASRVTTEGTVTLTVTGRANGEYRTIEAAVGKGGSTDYVYYTDFESADPSNVQAYPSGTSAACGGSGYDAAKYWWEGRSGAGCSEITFASGDTLQGTVFSNDSVLAAGPKFTDGFLTANPECQTVTTSTASSNWKWCLRKDSGTYSTADFNGVLPQYHEPLYLDDTSAAFAGFPGCHYFGSTRIVFNSDGTMTVWNKTVNNGGTAPTASGANGGTEPSCGSLAQLDSASGATVSVPTDLVIYVGSAPASVDRRKCYGGEIGGATGATLPLGSYKSTTPVTPVQSTASYTYDTNMNETTKYCAEGNVYVEGVLKGRVTVAAAQSVVVTGDIVLAGGLTGTDMLGLVATNSVEAFHPWVATYSPTKVNPGCSSNCAYKWAESTASTTNSSVWPRQYNDPTGATSVSGLQIMGSIQTLQHSFYVQKYKEGASLGLLQVNGSIAQRWRGIVGTGSGAVSSTGYLKNYVYDTRLKYAAPPYFPRWVNAQWSQRYFGEITTPPELRG